jgi:hypothetical protein
VWRFGRGIRVLRPFGDGTLLALGDAMKALLLVLCASLGLQLGCGTILYPNRRGQTSGHVDTGVAVMDGLWCLAFIIPGVVAFIVDFGNGSIYEDGRH